MKKYLRHILTAIICFVLIVVLNFLLPRLLPGNPIGYLTGLDEETLSKEMYQYYYHALHLDENIMVQFGYYLRSLFDGTLGFSFKKNLTVSSLIVNHIGLSLSITIPAFIISSSIALLWGVKAGYKKGKLFDKASTTFLLIQNAIPSFAIGLLLIIFLAFKNQIFPYMGLSCGDYPKGSFEYFADYLYHMFLPVLSIVLATLPSRYLLVRNITAEYKNSRDVSFANQRGLPTIKVEYKYLFRNIAQPYIASLGVSLGLCFSGSIVIENIFSINGIGGLLNEGIHTLDYPLIQGILFFTTLMMITFIVIADVICILIDPKIRKGANYEKK